MMFFKELNGWWEPDVLWLLFIKTMSGEHQIVSTRQTSRYLHSQTSCNDLIWWNLIIIQLNLTSHSFSEQVLANTRPILPRL